MPRASWHVSIKYREIFDMHVILSALGGVYLNNDSISDVKLIVYIGIVTSCVGLILSISFYSSRILR